MPYVLNDWFLLEVEKYIARLEACLALKELRRLMKGFGLQLQQMYRSMASISLWRLILLVLKRFGSIIKNWLKENRVDECLKAILHGSYLVAFEGLYLFLYFLHFFRAFLTLIDYFADQDNKNLVEVTKFLYACFKIFISLLMLAFMIVMLANGIAPLGLALYHNIKIFFLVYSLSKLAISFFTLGFSFINYKNANSVLDQVWLKKHYENNIKKHREILMVAVPITLALTLVSLGLVTGPWFWVMVAIASIFLLIDMAKAIYYYVNGSGVPEPKVGQLPQENAFFDVSRNNYYYRKCRTARLKNDDMEGNRIYLLKEIIVKIIQLQTKLENNSASRFSFFSEKQKIQTKIDGLKQEASILLSDNYEENKSLFDDVFKALKEDYQQLNENDKTLIPKKNIKNLFINDEIAILNELLHRRDAGDKKNPLSSQSFRQSFFRKVGDCQDIAFACQKQKELEQKELSTETCLQPFPVRVSYILVAG
ncbi:MAG: hypothetical protein RJA83_170 [Pseudomonadota bacterium]|jgi:hypothetical protein